MEVLRAILLGAIQGITEFLPVSSSGHRVLLAEMLGRELEGEGSTAESVLLHLGSLIAILWVFRRDVTSLVYPRVNWRLLGMLLIASIPAAVAGLTIKKLLPGAQEAWIEANVLQSPWVACFGLMFTAVLLWLAEIPRRLHVTLAGAAGMQYWLVGVVGLAQMVALLPGVSRSGATICTALMLYWVRSDAVRLSFLMGIIAIGGAGLVEARDIQQIEPVTATAGFVSSVAFSLVGLWLVKLIVAKEKLRWFAVYCAVAGLAALGYLIAYPPA
jgi:undecaprenyl-diphosphatase